MEGGNQLVVVSSRRDGQYVVIDQIGREFVFQENQKKANARGKYIGEQNRSILPHEAARLRDTVSAPKPPSSLESFNISFSNGSATIPEASRHSLKTLLPMALAAKRIVIVARPARAGHDHGTGLMRAAAVRKWLVSQGVSRVRIRVVMSTVSTTPAEYCEVQLRPEQPRIKVSKPPMNIAEPHPAFYGAARPAKVSLIARPRYVERGFGTTYDGLIGR
jgi:outer membrane protein OmpA-like peptidoglycan-associated protein